MTRILGPIYFLFSMFIFLCYITVPDKTWIFSKGFHNVYSSLVKWLEKTRISFFVVVPLLNVQCSYHTETNQLTLSANQLTGFCVIGALDVNCFTLGLGKNNWKLIIRHWNNLIGFWNSCSKSVIKTSICEIYSKLTIKASERHQYTFFWYLYF